MSPCERTRWLPVAAVYKGVDELRCALFPSLHRRKEGWLRHQENREATEADAAGVVFLFFSFGKPPRPRCQRMLCGVLLIARPPLLAVMQGGDYRLISIHSHVHRPPLQL